MVMPSPIAESLSSAAALAGELERQRLLPHERLVKLIAEFPGGGALSFAEFLIVRGELTPYQAERTMAGQGGALILGQYRILDPHHVGSFGPIFRAKKGDSEFALRVLPLRSLWQAKQANQLVRALAAVGTLPGVVPLVDADSANGSHYLAWPLTNGTLLSDWVADRGPLPPGVTIEFLIRLAAALAACHAAKIVHGLLTPQAICIQKDGSPRLLEVGAGLLLARNLASEDSLFDTMSESLAVAGACEFAAPEWVADPGRPAAAADQYSLGSIGCFALTGSSPPTCGAPSWPANTPQALIDVLDRMRQPDPANRFASLDEARAALAEAGSLGKPGAETDFAEYAGDFEEPVDPMVDEWTPPSELLRPPERDDSEASVHFDLPDHQEEAGAQMPAFEARETPPPSHWRTAAIASRPAPSPPHEDDFDSLPELPAGPLPPLKLPPSSSASWEVARREPSTTTSDKPTAAIWKRMKRTVQFWKSTGDAVHISVFGPRQARHSESPRFTVYLHPASAAASVATLARAFHHDAVLLGTGPLSQPVHRGERLEVHAAIDHASASNPLGGVKWQGQPQPVTFDFVVPWEAPVCVARGTVSVGRDQVRIGKLEFGLPIRDGAV